MKKSKVLSVLIVILVILTLATVYINTKGIHRSKISSSDASLLSFKSSDVTAFKWTVYDTEFSFEKQNGQWVNADDAGFPVKESVLYDKLSEIEDYKAVYMVEDVKNFAQYGLKDPACTISVTVNGSEYNLALGALSAMDKLRYVSTGDGKVYMAEYDVYDVFDCDDLSLMNVSNIPNMYDNRGFEISGINKVKVLYGKGKDYAYSDEFKLYLQDGNKLLPLGDLPSGKFLKTLDNYEFIGYEKYKAGEEDFAQYELKNPQLKFYSEYVDENGSDAVYEFGASKIGDKVYARVKGSDIIYIWSNEAFDWLAGIGYNELRSTSVVILDWTLVDRINVAIDNEKYQIDCAPQPDGSISYTFDGQPADCSDICTKIEQLALTEFCDERPNKKSELSFTIHTSANKNVKVDIYRYNDESCLVLVDNVAFGICSRDEVLDLREAIYDIALSK